MAVNFPVRKYDKEHDILHIYLNDRCSEQYSSAEEIGDGIYCLVDDSTSEINGYKILDYQKKAQEYEQKRQTFLSDSQSDITDVYPSPI